jgi:hypothetical protein
LLCFNSREDALSNGPGYAQGDILRGSAAMAGLKAARANS